MIKPPRTELPTQALAALEAFFDADLRPICEGVPVRVSYLHLDERLQDCLRGAVRTGCLTQGLESIAKLLDDEKKWLVEVQKRTGQPPAQRMSRLLFLSNDGSERFYRQAASLLGAHGNRLACARLDAPSETLGSLLAGARGNPAKAVLINDKRALGAFLAAVARHLPVPVSR
jgi:hypothetical protein